MPARSGGRFRMALSLPVLLAAALAPAVAAVPAAGAAPRAGSIRAAARSASQGPLTVTQAAARARATGKPVVAGALTTATSQTTALPGGELVLTESLQPVRALRGGTWVPLNPDLVTTAGGRLAPAITAQPLSLSAGGSGPLAVLDNGGRTLTLSWPGGPLPAPVISGPTATYPGVEPGIDLAVTATPQGGIDEVLIIRDAAAAASQGLATALQTDLSAPGMTITADPDGGVSVTTGPLADPAFTSPAPRIWDSAAPPAGTATGTVNGVTVVSPSGMPAASAITAPGAYAHVRTATQSVSGGTVTVTAPAGSLSGPGVVYPVYVDPNWDGTLYYHGAAAWTQIDKGLPGNTSDWMESGSPYLQVGYCDPNNMSSCNGIGVTRTMFRFPLPTGLPSNTTVNSADMSFDNLWQSANCAAEPLQLWTTPAISSSTDWSNSSSWTSELEQETFAGFGHSGCPSRYPDVTFGTGTTATGGSASSLAGSLTTAIDHGQSTETFGLRAADESTTDGTAWLQWRYFQDTASDISMSLHYHYPPAKPALSTTPADCQVTTSAAPVIGNDDIGVYFTMSDGDGDTGLTTTATVYNSSGTVKDGPWSYGPGAGVTYQQIGVIHRGDLTASGWYHVTATTTDSFGGKSPAATCYFYLDLTAPSPPVVTGLPTTPVPLGYQLTGLKFSPSSGTSCTGTPDPCPATYTYQIGDLAPVTVTADSSGVWAQPATAPITIPVYGPFEFRISGADSAKNPSVPFSQEIFTTKPASPLPDGYFTGGSYPDLLTTNLAANDHSLWLSPGTGNGQVGPAIDIGGLGTGISPGSDGPGDWNAAQVLHGDLTGNNFQDVMAYYTGAGSNSVIMGGIGTVGPLNPYSGNTYTITQNPAPPMQPPFCDTEFNNSCPLPTELVYAGNASQEGPATNDGSTYGQTNNADLIGIFGPGGQTGSTYELALYTAVETGGYAFDYLYGNLSGPTYTSPDGTADWQDYALATAQLPDTAYPNGDPSNTVLFALDGQPGNAGSGNLYVSANPSPGCNPSATTCTSLIGMPGTWAKVTGTPSSWATSPPQLASADVNNGTNGPGSGTPEIWTITGKTATAYTTTGITTATPAAAAEGSGSPLTYPDNAWALDDGAANPGANPTTATDSVTGNSTGTFGPAGDTCTWSQDLTFNTVLDTTDASRAPPNAT